MHSGNAGLAEANHTNPFAPNAAKGEARAENSACVRIECLPEVVHMQVTANTLKAENEKQQEAKRRVGQPTKQTRVAANGQ